MIDISSKLSGFKKIVWDAEKRKSEEELYESINNSSDLVDEKKKDLEERSKAYLNKREAFAKTRKNELVAKKTEEEKSSFNIYKEDLLKKILAEIRQRLIAYTSTKDYREKLVKDVNKTYQDLKKSTEEDFILLVKKEDQNLFTRFNTKTMDESYLGGFIFENIDGSYRYDFSLQKKLKDEEYFLGKKLYALWEEGENLWLPE